MIKVKKMDLDGKDSRQSEPTTHLVPKNLLSLNPRDTPRSYSYKL